MPPCRPSFTSSKARCRIKRRVFRAPHELNKSLISAIWSFVPSNLSITICLRKVCWKSSAESSWKVPVSHSSDVPDDNAKNCKWHVKFHVNEQQYGQQLGSRSDQQKLIRGCEASPSMLQLPVTLPVISWSDGAATPLEGLSVTSWDSQIYSAKRWDEPKTCNKRIIVSPNRFLFHHDNLMKQESLYTKNKHDIG